MSRRRTATAASRLRRRGETATITSKGLSSSGRMNIPFVLGGGRVKFSELVRLLEANGFGLVRQKGSVRYYGKAGWPNLIRVDYHGAREVPTGTCNSILKAAGVRKS